VRRSLATFMTITKEINKQKKTPERIKNFVHRKEALSRMLN